VNYGCNRAADSRGLVTIATKQTAAEIAKVIPIPCDRPHPIHLESAIAPPPNPVPSVWPSESLSCIDDDTIPAEYSLVD
jgi:hypothetical protein